MLKSLKERILLSLTKIKNYKEFCEIVKPNVVSIDYNIDPKKIVDDIEKVVNEFRDQLPSEISLEKVYDESYYFKEKFNTLYTSILFAILIVVGISYFLLGFKSALIVGSVIPLTIFLVLFGFVSPYSILLCVLFHLKELYIFLSVSSYTLNIF